MSEAHEFSSDTEDDTEDDDRGVDSLASSPRALHALPVTDVRTDAADDEVWTEVRLAGRTRRGGDGERSGSERARRLSGLDGLRAIAVVAVVVFHLDVSSAPGGFLGVDVFFVISGFLITNLICTELLDTGGFALGAFYRRRARRLLPTVLVLLAVVVVAANTVWRDQLATLKGGVVSSLFYVTNWWLIADHESYFVQTGRPTMVQHLWSLAIEEQYYLVWSLAVALIAGALLARRRVDPARRMPLVVAVAGGLAIASTVLMAIYAVVDDLPYKASTSRVYFGSDTHTMGLFLGSAAGAYLALQTRRRSRGDPTAWVWLTDVAGAVVLCVIGYQFLHLDEFSVGLYRGGFLLFDLLALVVIGCAVRPAGRLGRVLDMRPVRWVGQRSYAIYVWHWPVVVVTRPGIDIGGPVWLVNLERVVVILALAALSYRFVEVPLRTGSWRHARRMPDLVRRVRRNDIAATVVASACVVGLIAAANPVDATGPARITGAPSTGPVTRHTAAPPTPTSPCPPVQHNRKRRTAPSISAFGDSVLLGAQRALHARTRAMQFDAVEGRQAYDVLDDVRTCAKAGGLLPNVLIDVGDNGIISPGQLDTVLQRLHGARRVLLFTVRVPRDWQDPNNRTIRAAARRHHNVKLVDWNALSRGKGSWLYSDGIHLRPPGAAAYARITVAALRD